jgi:hypothetical protein
MDSVPPRVNRAVGKCRAVYVGDGRDSSVAVWVVVGAAVRVWMI